MDNLVERVAKAMAPRAFEAFDRKIHCSKPSQAAAQSMWIKNAQAAIEATGVVELREALESCMFELSEMYRATADTKRDAAERIENDGALVAARKALTLTQLAKGSE